MKYKNNMEKKMKPSKESRRMTKLDKELNARERRRHKK